MSQERLADLLGITFQQVQKYERGVNRIAASRLSEICKVLNVPAQDIMDGLGDAPREMSNERLTAFLATPEGADLAWLFPELRSQSVRRRVLDLVRTLVAEQALA
jgi:transcriptional regulator with XRE-family HTH domain